MLWGRPAHNILNPTKQALRLLKSGLLLFGNFFEIRYFVLEIHRKKISYTMEALYGLPNKQETN